MKQTTTLLALAAVATACRGPVELASERPIVAVESGQAVSAPPARPSSDDTATLPSSYRGAATTPTGVVVPVLGASPDGWLVGTPCGKTATVRTVKALSGTVVLDAGHGGEETGAVGAQGTLESHLNTAVVDHARRALEEAGITVVLTRTDDYRIGIAPRAAIVAAVKPKAVVSVHHNASSSRVLDEPGTEVFHQSVGTSVSGSRRLAGLLYEEVTAALARFDIAQWAATPWAGVKPRPNAEGNDYYGILRRTQGTPTALLEVGFLSHRPEERLFNQAAVQQAVGEAVARGVVRFLNTADTGSGFIPTPHLADDNRPGGGTENCGDPPLG